MSDDPKANANPKPGQAPSRLRPTIIEIAAKRAKSRKDATPEPGAPPRPAPIVSTPTIIPGVGRKRIRISAADITRLSPGAPPRTAAHAVRLVDGFVVEGAREQHVTAWGHAAQQRHAALAPETLELSRTEVLRQARSHVGRIAELLGAIDLEAVCGVRPSPRLDIPEPSGKRIDTPRKLTAVRGELQQIAYLARVALPGLVTFKASLDDHARRIDEAGFEIEAAALAALFLSDHLTTLQPELSRRFLQREMSLTQTALEIRGGQFERDSRGAEARALITAIQDVVLVALPDWLESVAALRPARHRLNPTEAGDLQHRLRVILRKLET